MDQKFIDLFDRYTHGGMNRRDFLERLSALAGSAAAALALLPVLENNYAQAELVPENDPAITAAEAEIAPGIKGYLVRPAAAGTYPAVLVIHENRGLNPHIRDVARRFAKNGYVAIALDLLSREGGTAAHDRDAVPALLTDAGADRHVGDFLAAAQVGDLMEATGEVTRAGGRLIYVRGLITANGKPALSFTSVITRVNRKPAA